MFTCVFLCTFAAKDDETTMPERCRYECIRLTGVSALLHFLVDGLCICCLYLTTADCAEMVMTYVVYNVLAFLTQPLTGWMADSLKQKHWMLLASVLLLTLAVMMAAVTTDNGQQTTGYGLLVVSVLLGIGNSLFHVWGGKQTAVRTENDIRALGVFVSTGAFGLAIGAVFASWLLLYALLLSICLLAMTAVFLFPERRYTYEDGCYSVFGDWNGIWFFIVLIMLIVAGRSFASEAFTVGITKGRVLILVLGATSMLGKMAGGWLVKGLGMWKAVLLMVLGAILCFIGKDVHISVVLTGLFLVNCTMPITLYWANVFLRGREGLAFGLLAAALMPGYLLAQTELPIVRIIGALIPTILIEYGVLWMLKERRKKVLLSSIAVNVLTNVPLNLYLNFIDDSLGSILIGEVAVFLIEAVWYWFFTRSLKQATIYSFLCNAISFLVGWLLFMLFVCISIFTSNYLYGDIF